MSKQVICDACGKVQASSDDYCVSDMIPRSRWMGWVFLDVEFAFYGSKHYDFCCLKCSRDWAEGKIDEAD